MSTPAAPKAESEIMMVIRAPGLGIRSRRTSIRESDLQDKFEGSADSLYLRLSVPSLQGADAAGTRETAAKETIDDDREAFSII